MQLLSCKATSTAHIRFPQAQARVPMALRSPDQIQHDIQSVRFKAKVTKLKIQSHRFEPTVLKLRFQR
jgi:hypothetical protein